MLGADTRSTAGTTVADKNCEKIHFIAPSIYCCGAGTAADTENVTGADLGCCTTVQCVREVAFSANTVGPWMHGSVLESGLHDGCMQDLLCSLDVAWLHYLSWFEGSCSGVVRLCVLLKL